MLHLPPGWPGSGRHRYAAAVAHHAQGGLSNRALEAFRTLAPRDRDDPAPLLAGERLPPPPRPDPTEAVGALRTELLDLLHRLRGPGLMETRQALARAGSLQGVAAHGDPVAPWLAPALAPGEPALAQALAEAAPHLAWQRYDYPDPSIGPSFPKEHAFCSLLGEVDAPYRATGLDIGLFVMAPRLFYRDHAHPAPELYLPLTGPHRWRFAPGAPLVERPALSPVWNDPEVPHAIKVGEVPFLALYAWLDRPQDPARVVPADDWDRHEGPP